MPTFVIQSIGRPASKVSVDMGPIRIGRDEGNDIVIPDETVSREHAVVLCDMDGLWTVGCVSETNPIVVDGTLTRESAGLTEGSEVLVGSSHLIIFSEDAHKADRYINVKTVFQKSRCTGCGWEGLISTARRNAACPRCNGASFVEVGGYSGEAARSVPAPASPVPTIPTAALSAAEAKKRFHVLRTAMRSHIERVDAHAGPAPRTPLAEDRPCTLSSRSPDPMLSLRGMAFGHVTVTLNGNRYEAVSSMTFPPMRVNGEEARAATLYSGDVIEVGDNRFRFVTE